MEQLDNFQAPTARVMNQYDADVYALIAALNDNEKPQNDFDRALLYLMRKWCAYHAQRLPYSPEYAEDLRGSTDYAGWAAFDEQVRGYLKALSRRETRVLVYEEMRKEWGLQQVDYIGFGDRFSTMYKLRGEIQCFRANRCTEFDDLCVLDHEWLARHGLEPGCFDDFPYYSWEELRNDPRMPEKLESMEFYIRQAMETVFTMDMRRDLLDRWGYPHFPGAFAFEPTY